MQTGQRNIMKYTVLLAALLASTASADAADLFVSPSGSDANPGTLERPLATVERARDLMRSHKAAGPATVHLRAGTYLLRESVSFTAEDSGTASAPAIYKAYRNEEVHMVGGRMVNVSQFKPVSDPKIGARLDPAARGNVVELDLSRLSIRHAERPADMFVGTGGLMELYFNNRRMPISRWPNGGYTTMKEVIDGGTVDARAHGGAFIYRGDRPERWTAALSDGVWIAGFWRVPWVVQAVRVESIDTRRRVITHAVGIPQGIGSKYTPAVNGTRHGDGKEPWYAMNLLEEIDQPGEWCIHFPTRKLYFWPPEDPAHATVLIADMNQPLVTLRGASHVTLQGLTIEAALGPAVRVEGGEDVRIVGCTIRNAGSGIDIVSGKAHRVESCDLYEIGAGALRIAGGDRIRLQGAGHLAVNNHIHHCGRTLRTVEAVLIEGVGNRLVRNLLHDLTYGGVRYLGNDHVMEGNEIHNIGLDGGDLGAFYSPLDWAARGNIVRGNFIHHAPNANAVYMDDGHSGDHILSNLAYLAGCGPFIGGGHDHEVRSNLVIECQKGVHLDDRGVSRHYNMQSKSHVGILPRVNFTQPPYATRYPELVTMMSRPELLEYPTGNRIEQNIFVACGNTRDAHVGRNSQRYVKLDDNLNVVAAPGLIDPRSLELRPAALATIVKKMPAFEPIAMEKVGLYVDSYRRVIPTAEETGRNQCRPPRRVFDSNVDMERSNRPAGQ